jgi:hypothetical protein
MNPQISAKPQNPGHAPKLSAGLDRCISKGNASDFDLKFLIWAGEMSEITVS